MAFWSMSRSFESPTPLSEKSKKKLDERFVRAVSTVAHGLQKRGYQGYYSHGRKQIEPRLRDEIRETALSIREEGRGYASNELTHLSLGVERGLVVGAMCAEVILNTQHRPRFVRCVTADLRIARNIPSHQTPYDITDVVARTGNSYAHLFKLHAGSESLQMRDSVPESNSSSVMETRMQVVYENSVGYMCAEAMTFLAREALAATSGLRRHERVTMENQADVFERMSRITTATVGWLQSD